MINNGFDGISILYKFLITKKNYKKYILCNLNKTYGNEEIKKDS